MEQVAQRVRQQVEASLNPGGPILQLSDETEGHWDAADVQCSGGRGASSWPPARAISSPTQYCGLRLRRGTRIRELPEVLRRWCSAWSGARDLPEAAEGEAGSARRGGEAAG